MNKNGRLQLTNDRFKQFTLGDDVRLRYFSRLITGVWSINHRLQSTKMTQVCATVAAK